MLLQQQFHTNAETIQLLKEGESICSHKSKPIQVPTILQGLTTDNPDKLLKSTTNLSQKLAHLGFVYEISTD